MTADSSFFPNNNLEGGKPTAADLFFATEFTEQLVNQITPYSLWLGHAGHGRDVVGAMNAGVRVIVQLALEEPIPTVPRDLAYYRIPLIDGSENDPVTLEMAVHTVAALVQRKIPTLVCCGAGMSRSPAVAATALAYVEGKRPAKCLEFVLEQHGGDVSPGLWNDLNGIQLSTVDIQPPAP
ncbi:MAG: dual specificity protein phosphatase family protein [Planctomycetales bacterium]